MLALFGTRTIPQDGSPGLVFERFMRLWTTELDDRDRGTQRGRGRGDHKPPISSGLLHRLDGEKLRDALLEFIDNYEQARTTIEPLLRTNRERMNRALQSMSDRCSDTRPFLLVSRMAVGTGADHPLENSLTLDYTLGVPIVPGSAVKGLCRDAAEMVGLPEEMERVLFGHSQDELRLDNKGDIVFHTAWPETWPQLQLDVINCHHPVYYGDTRRKEKPVDYESPIPVYFLAVAPGTSFGFSMESRTGNRNNLDLMFELLQFALETFGTGSKTAVGYGRWRATSAR